MGLAVSSVLKPGLTILPFMITIRYIIPLVISLGMIGLSDLLVIITFKIIKPFSFVVLIRIPVGTIITFTWLPPRISVHDIPFYIFK